MLPGQAERVVQVILSLITWVYMSNICTLEPHHFALLEPVQKFSQNLKYHGYMNTVGEHSRVQRVEISISFPVINVKFDTVVSLSLEDFLEINSFSAE